MAPESDANSVKGGGMETYRSTACHGGLTDSLELIIHTEATPADTLYDCSGIPSLFKVQAVEFDFYTTRTIPPYPLVGCINSESLDSLLLSPLSGTTLEQWRQTTTAAATSWTKFAVSFHRPRRSRDESFVGG
ncbi:hypothetical protein QBC36DRAFT_295788 [Triangularia setosa]|uniref:Uncharacterized protein n=1 Tax=Triangularia setosa TaxID=2587417 RepID=A0AAN7A2J2_9PEZI|nr:hypothetical protein QBC36DRAFT_295788 [Podospora setosa]